VWYGCGFFAGGLQMKKLRAQKKSVPSQWLKENTEFVSQQEEFL